MFDLLFIYLQRSQEAPGPLFSAVFGVIIILLTGFIIVFNVLTFGEIFFVKYYKRPLYIHFYLTKKAVTKSQMAFLKANDFYNKLDRRRKSYFQHRVANFIETTTFVSRDGIVIDDYKKMEVSMLVIQMTFGMRKYLFESVERVILYPSSYFSILNQTENNGEFNPRSKALVLSWYHFEQGIRETDNGNNLGIHEITHAIHYNSIKSKDVSSEIFHDTFLELEKYLASEILRNKIVDAKILREYAYTNKFEFIAVLVEVFMETPEILKKQFPKIYEYVSRMLNFRYFDG